MNQFIKAFAGCFVAMLWGFLLYAQPNITRVEYYIDNDPGYNNATPVSITPGANLSNLTINVNPADLSLGVHMLGIRVKDANGAWSLDNRWLFAKPYANDTIVPGAAPNITKVEYYMESDPGYDQGIPVPVTPGTNLSNLTVSLNPGNLTLGVHIIGIRAKDAKGAWSEDNKWLYARPYANDTVPQRIVPKLSRVEYYLDNDPGYGNGIAVAIDSVTNIANLSLSVNISGLDTGSHVIYIRSLDAKGSWNQDNKWSFKINQKSATPSVTLSSVSRKSLCTGDIFNVGYDVKGTFNAGNVFTIQLSSSTGDFSSPVNIGSIEGTKSGVVQCVVPLNTSSGTNYRVRVISSNPAKTSNSSADKLSISSKTDKPTITPSGPTTICQGDSVTLTSSPSSAYMWNTGATTQSIAVSKSGKYVVTAGTGNCAATSDTTIVSYKTCGKPVGLTVTTISATTATVRWKSVACAAKYNVQYRKNGTTTWTTVPTTDTITMLTSLTAGTTYNWRVQTVCGSGTSSYVNGTNFTTAVSFTANVMSSSTKTNASFNASVYPNPVSTNAVLSISGTYKPLTIILTDLTGKIILESANVTASRINLPVANLRAGMYIISVTDGADTKILKLIKGQQ